MERLDVHFGAVFGPYGDVVWVLRGRVLLVLVLEDDLVAALQHLLQGLVYRHPDSLAALHRLQGTGLAALGGPLLRSVLFVPAGGAPVKSCLLSGGVSSEAGTFHRFGAGTQSRCCIGQNASLVRVENMRPKLWVCWVF